MIRFALYCILLLATATPLAHADYADLRAEYDRLGTYLGAKRRIDPSDLVAIQALRTQADALATENPEDPRPITLAIQLSTWLGEPDRVDQDFARLSRIADHDRVWLAWADSRIADNRYDDAYVLLADREVDLNTSPAHALTMARCLMARNRFDEAITTLEAIPADALTGDPRLRGRVSAMQAEANRWKSLWEDEMALREQEEADSDLPIMQIVTSRGPLTVLLFENQAPNTVANFVNLAEDGFFNGQRFHRVVPNFVAQAGDPNSRIDSTEEPGSGGPGYTIPDEASNPGKRMHFAGVLAMAKPPSQSTPGQTAPNSAGSQWYITLEPQESLNKEYTVFGRVLDGQIVAEKIRKNDEILAVTTISRREKDYLPTTIPLPETKTDEGNGG